MRNKKYIKREKRPSELCVLCGRNPATSWDDLPPKGMFANPKPTDPIKVPACGSCNSGKKSSGADEIFQVFIGIAAGHGEQGEQMFKDHVTKIIKSNRKLKRSIAETKHYREFVTPSGLYLGRKECVRQDSKSCDAVIERIIRGLHWQYAGNIIGDKAAIKVRWHRTLTAAQIKMTELWQSDSVGGDQFIFKYAISEEAPLASVWLLQFFNCTWWSATVIPKIIDSEQAAQPDTE